MTAQNPLHLVVLYNPYYCRQVIEEHLEVLLSRIDAVLGKGGGARKRADEYVWFGKLVSRQRRGQELRHLDRILDLDKQCAAGVETHLYLTEHARLHVGKVERIVDALHDEHEIDTHVPRYYQDLLDRRKLKIELWFKLSDIRRLSTDLEETNDRLANLETLDAKRTFSLYAGRYEYPVLVQEKTAERLFDYSVFETESGQTLIGVPQSADRQPLLPLRAAAKWADLERGQGPEVQRMCRELRWHMFGDRVWGRLPVDAQYFLANAEVVFRRAIDDRLVDFSPVIVQYAKAVEILLRDRLYPRLREVLRCEGVSGIRVVDYRSRSTDFLSTDKPIPVSETNRLLGESTVANVIRARMTAHEAFLLGELPELLSELVAMRNPAAHSNRIGQADALDIRRKILGIGCWGLIPRLTLV